MPSGFLFVVILAAITIFSFSFSSYASADELSQAKSSGFVGEKPDGYLGVVSGAAPRNVVNMMNSINQKRKARYRAIGAQNGQALNVVESLAGNKLVSGTRAGNYYMTRSGQWVKK